MRETPVEQHLVRVSKKLGALAYKFVSPNRRHVPDRLLLAPIPEEDREVVARYVRFVETKAPGKKARPGQVREHARLRKLGYQVHVPDSKEAASEIIQEMSCAS